MRRAITIAAIVLLAAILGDIGIHRGWFANAVRQVASSPQPSATPSANPAVVAELPGLPRSPLLYERPNR
jgi:hypothetical protein